MTWFQLDEFTSQTGAFILRGTVIIGGIYAAQLVGEPPNVYRPWCIVVPSESNTGELGGDRVSIDTFRCVTSIRQMSISAPARGGTRRLAYYFPERDRLGARTVRLYRWQPP